MLSKVLILLVSIACFSNTFGQSESELFKQVFKSKERWVPVNIVFQNKDLGEIPVKFDGNTPRGLLKVKSTLKKVVVSSLKLTDTEMSLSELKSLGITFSLNEEKFYFNLDILPSLIALSVTDFALDFKPKWVDEYSTSSEYSFFSNFFYYRPYHHKSNLKTSSELDIEPNLQVKGFLLEGSHTYTEDQLNRNFTRIVYDRTNNAARSILGDNSGPTTEFLSPVEFLGFSYGKDFSLRPYDVTVPRGKAEFELDSRSTVRVYVNGSLLQILRLDPGVHKLEELPLIQGLNEIKLVIESELGRIDEIIIPSAFSQDLLKVGLSDYYYGVGKKSESTKRDRDYQDDNIFTAFHRYGFTDVFTLGGFFQGDNVSQLLGSDQILSTSLGQIKTQVAATTYSSQRGLSLKGEYFFIDQRAKGEGAVGHLLGLSYFSNKFKRVGESNPFGYARRQLNYSFNQNLYGASIRLGGEYSWNQSVMDTWGLVGSVGKTFNRRFNINVITNYKQLQNDSSSFDVSLFFNWFLPEAGHNLYGNYNSSGNNSQVTLQKIQTSASDDFSYQATARNDELGQSVEFDTNFNHQRIEVGLRHTQSNQYHEGWSSYDGRIKLASAVGIVGGQFAIGRPITNGFALIHRDELTSDQDIKINKSGDDYAYKSDFMDNMMISKLQAYRFFQMNIDSTQLDDGISLEREEFSLLPSYKAGVYVPLVAKGSLSVFAKLLLPSGKPAKLATLDILNSEGKIINGTFTNRKGRILVEGLEASRYEIRISFRGEQFNAKIDLPKDKIGLLDLGIIKLKKVIK
ncbi:hypothetical protein A9Q84_16685 [Halobacteriovorax marinus]|uniref:Uncharacterized protein n=1 Tax=Halobacteriovorax marinus TaxID=97084 RepID=A0A1Y5F9X0_9BACT|nr:hypothetical protein A9Q84_16685 [Halobacteriovorax marinus]